MNSSLVQNGVTNVRQFCTSVRIDRQGQFSMEQPLVLAPVVGTERGDTRRRLMIVLMLLQEAREVIETFLLELFKTLNPIVGNIRKHQPIDFLHPRLRNNLPVSI